MVSNLRFIFPLLAFFLVACTNAPVQEMSNARQAIDLAHQLDAYQHAPQLMNMAQNRLSDAELALQQGKWKMAKNSAIQARGHAIEARVKVVSYMIEN